MDEVKNKSLMENEYVQDILSILHENDKDISGLTDLVKYVDSMGNHLKTTVDELQSMRVELSSMREERDHPVRTAIQNTNNLMEAKINGTRAQLGNLKGKIIEGCKNTIADFKQKGISALNITVKFLGLKPAFESLRDKLQDDIKQDEASIAKIESISTRYHSAGMHLRNVGRVLLGKEAITAIKPNGILAKLAEAPFHKEIKRLNKSLKDVEKIISSLDNLDKAAPKKEVSAESMEDKPSTIETMKILKEKISQDKLAVPAMEKPKHIGVEL